MFVFNHTRTGHFVVSRCHKTLSLFSTFSKSLVDSISADFDFIFIMFLATNMHHLYFISRGFEIKTQHIYDAGKHSLITLKNDKVEMKIEWATT